MLQFVFNFRAKTTPKCFSHYFQSIVQIHNYLSKFNMNNLAVVDLTKFLPNHQYNMLEVNFEIKCLKKLKIVFV